MLFKIGNLHNRPNNVDRHINLLQLSSNLEDNDILKSKFVLDQYQTSISKYTNI